MIYRPVGINANNQIAIPASVTGLGTEHLDRKPYKTVETVIHAALDYGINIMDLFMPGDEVRQNIGRALEGRRDKMLIQGHIGSTDISQQYDMSRDRKTVQKYFENLLRCLNTDYIDFGMLFFLDSEKDYKDVFEGDTLPYALELKKQGKVRMLCASSHNPIIAKKVVETGLIDVLMFSVNPAFDMADSGTNVLDYLGDAAMNYEKNLDPVRAGLYRICEQRGVSITVMKTLGAGKLISPEFSPFGKPLSVTQCIHYALTRPAVASVLLGCCTKEQVEEAVHYLEAGDDEKDYSGIISRYQGGMKGSCVYCSHCLPCPSEINIAEVNKYLDIAELDKKNVPPSVMGHYRALGHKASECAECGSCEERCPFAVKVIDRMKKAAALFEAGR